MQMFVMSRLSHKDYPTSLKHDKLPKELCEAPPNERAGGLIEFAIVGGLGGRDLGFCQIDNLSLDRYSSQAALVLISQ